MDASASFSSTHLGLARLFSRLRARVVLTTPLSFRFLRTHVAPSPLAYDFPRGHFLLMCTCFADPSSSLALLPPPRSRVGFRPNVLTVCVAGSYFRRRLRLLTPRILLRSCPPARILRHTGTSLVCFVSPLPRTSPLPSLPVTFLCSNCSLPPSLRRVPPSTSFSSLRSSTSFEHAPPIAAAPCRRCSRRLVLPCSRRSGWLKILILLRSHLRFSSHTP